jgi:hypothetical protein
VLREAQAVADLAPQSTGGGPAAEHGIGMLEALARVAAVIPCPPAEACNFIKTYLVTRFLSTAPQLVWLLNADSPHDLPKILSIT